jgi:ectoine utilization protein EutC
MKDAGITVVCEHELRATVPLSGEAIDAVEAAFVWAADGRVESPPIMHIAVPEHRGDVDIKSAYVRGESHFAVKIAAGFFDNPKLGLPSGSAMAVLIDARTGRPEMVYLDNSYLTDLRTAAAGAIAVRHLARPGSMRLGIVGSGVQARFQARAIALVRRLDEVLIAARSPDKAARYVEEMSRDLRVPVRAVSVEEMGAGSDVIVTTTPSTQPVLRGAWLRPGQTVVAMGSDAPTKRELDADAFRKAALVVCDNRKQCEVLGELHHALADRAVATGTDIVELGVIASRRHGGRASDADIVLCDLTGMGAQDTAIGLHARQKVRAGGLGWRAPAQSSEPV